MDELRRLGVLVDGDNDRYLLQIFMVEGGLMYDDRNAGPFFYEVIQRRGAQGFGEGNFRALFEAIERNQERPGNRADAARRRRRLVRQATGSSARRRARPAHGRRPGNDPPAAARARPEKPTPRSRSTASSRTSTASRGGASTASTPSRTTAAAALGAREQALGEHPGAAEPAWDGAVRRRHFRTARLHAGGAPFAARRLLLANPDLGVWLARRIHGDDTLVANADGDELTFVHAGSGRVESPLGVAAVLDRRLRVTCRARCRTAGVSTGPPSCSSLEARTWIDLPRQFRNPVGQLTMDAPYSSPRLPRAGVAGGRTAGARCPAPADHAAARPRSPAGAASTTRST